MPRAYIGVGSNIDPEANIPAAMRMLGEAVRIAGISTFYRTSPIGSPGAPSFYNGVVEIETRMPPREFKSEVLRRIEEALGRVRGAEKCVPRTIDLDIAVYGDIVINEPDLVIPDPDIPSRAFLALPLLELDPEMVLPGTKAKLADAVGSLDVTSMTALDEFTERLRREIGHEP